MIKRGRDSKLSSSILKRLWKLRKTPLVARRHGVLLLLSPRDFIDNRLLGYATFEDEQIKKQNRI